MHSVLFVCDAIYYTCNVLCNILYMLKDLAKLATFESQKEVVCMTHSWNPKKEGEKGYGVETNATGIVTLLKVLNKGRHG